MEVFIVDRNEIVDRFDPIFFLLKKKVFDSFKFDKYKISDLCEVRDGDHNKLPIKYITTKGNGIRYLRAQDLKNGEIDSSNPIYISKEYFNTIPRSHINPGYFLFSIMATIGSTAVVPANFDICTANRAIGFLIIKEKKELKEDYLFSFFNTNPGTSLLQSIKKGGLQQRINLRDIANLEIPIPPISIQETIIKIMNAAYSQRKLNEEEAEKHFNSINDYVLDVLGIRLKDVSEETTFIAHSNELKDTRADVFYHLPKFKSYMDSISNANYPMLEFGDIISVIAGGATPHRNKESEYYTTDEQTGIPFLRVQNITPGALELSDVKYIQKEVHNVILKRSQLKPGDLVFTITGRLGSAALIPEGFEGNINQHSVKIRLKDKYDDIKIVKPFIVAYLNSTIFNELCRRYATGGTRPALDYGAINKLPILLPPYEIQNQIAVETKKRMERAEKLKIEGESYLEKAKREVEKILFK